MVGSNGTMIAIRLVRSKLRKRDDQQHQVNQQQQHQQCCGPQVQVHPAGSTRCNLRGVDNPAMAADGDCSDELEICWANNNQQQPMATTTVNGNDEPFQHIWQFPPPPYPGKAAQRFALYNDQDSLVHGQGVVAGPVESQLQGQHQKSFRKNLGGRWRRLVRKKPPESTVCGAIPPELKDQLKTIYVY